MYINTHHLCNLYKIQKNISEAVLGSRNSSAEYAEFVCKYLLNAVFHPKSFEIRW
jgi:hypothetical protein